MLVEGFSVTKFSLRSYYNFLNIFIVITIVYKYTNYISQHDTRIVLTRAMPCLWYGVVHRHVNCYCFCHSSMLFTMCAYKSMCTEHIIPTLKKNTSMIVTWSFGWDRAYDGYCLKHWLWKKMTGDMHMVVRNVFSWSKSVVLWLKVH